MEPDRINACTPSEDQQERRNRFENLIAQAAKRFAREPVAGAQRIIADTLADLGRFMEADRARLWRYAPDGQMFVLASEWCAEDIAPQAEENRRLKIQQIPWWHQQMARYEPVCIHGLQELPPEAAGERAILEQQQVLSIAMTPVVHESQLLGFAGFHTVRTPKHWNDEDMRVLSTVADLLTGALIRQSAEEQLIAQRNFSNAVVDSLPGLFYMFDAEGRFVRWNRNFEVVSGYSADEIKAMTPLDFFSPDDAPRTAEAIQMVFERGFNTLENDFLTKEGRKIPHFFSGLAADVGGQRYLIGMAYDITQRTRIQNELIEKQRLLRQILDTSPNLIYIHDLDLDRHVFVNRPLEEFLGFPPGDIGKLGQMPLPAFIHAEDRSRADSYLEALKRATLGQTHVFEYRMKDAQGRWRWFQRRDAIFKTGPEGRVQQVVGTAHDISQRKQFEEERLSRERQRQQAQKAESLARMAGAVAHHFNNLLAAVMGNLELAIHDLPRASAVQEKLDEALQAAQRAAELSSLMLTYIGQARGKKEPLDLAATCAGLMPRLTASKPVRVGLKADWGGSGPMVQADAAQIGHVIGNLVTNAWEALGSGQGEVRLALGRVKAAQISGRYIFPGNFRPLQNTYAVIEVSDSGCGLTDDEMEKIFEPFFSTKFIGRGLGLPVVLGIVKAHGGAITVDSRPGAGTTFRVLIPALEKDIPVPGLRPMKAEAPIEGGGLVLVVEDEEVVRKVAEALLKRLGFSTLSVGDGVEALEVFRHHQDQIRCVLLDLTMPRCSGWEVLSQLRSLRPAVPVILASGYDEAQAMEGEHAEMPQAFLHKPYRTQELKAALAQAFARPGAKQGP
jgi:two-component system cell cycle sensor histidine kinase/response regulator CckA